MKMKPGWVQVALHHKLERSLSLYADGWDCRNWEVIAEAVDNFAKNPSQSVPSDHGRRQGKGVLFLEGTRVPVGIPDSLHTKLKSCAHGLGISEEQALDLAVANLYGSFDRDLDWRDTGEP